MAGAVLNYASELYTFIYRVGHICTVYDRMYGGFPAKSTVCTLYIPINVWFWPTLIIYIQAGFI